MTMAAATPTTEAVSVGQDREQAPRREAGAPSKQGLLRPGLAAAVVAALATSLVAAAAGAADVPLTIDGEEIPATGFAVATLMCSAVGLLLAGALQRWAPRPRAAFAGVLIAASFVPSVSADTDTATKVVLVATHLVAAAIVVPVIVRSLPARRPRP